MIMSIININIQYQIWLLVSSLAVVFIYNTLTPHPSTSASNDITSIRWDTPLHFLSYGVLTSCTHDS